MKYSEFKVIERGPTYVCGDTEEIEAFLKVFLQNNPEYKTEILPCLMNYKKPFLGASKPATDVMVKALKKSQRKAVIRELEAASRHTGLDNLIYRSPRALSGGQRLRWSMVYEAIMGKRCFIIREDTPYMNDELADQMCEWIVNYTVNDAKILYFAESDDCFPYDCTCYELCDGEINAFIIPLETPEPETVVETKAEEEKPQDETIAKILQMRNNYSGLFSGK